MNQINTPLLRIKAGYGYWDTTRYLYSDGTGKGWADVMSYDSLGRVIEYRLTDETQSRTRTYVVRVEGTEPV